MVKPKPFPDVTKTGVEFLKTELDTGLTLATIALDAEDNDKIQRNRKNARSAYDTVLKNQNRVALTDEETLYVSRKLLELRKKLERLGERFSA